MGRRLDAVVEVVVLLCALPMGSTCGGSSKLPAAARDAGVGGGLGGTCTGGAFGTGGVGTGGAPGTGGIATQSTGGVGATSSGGAGGAGGTVTTSVGCSQTNTQEECDSRQDCHSVFVDFVACDCAVPGCCARFDRCADGFLVDCVGPASCNTPGPFCSGPYVVAYANHCHDGCVSLNACRVPACPQSLPSHGSSCGPVAITCFYESCASTGRSRADCSAGEWTVQTVPCTETACTDSGMDGGALTCPAGKLCMLAESGPSGPLVPSCVENTCGTGPISTECVRGPGGYASFCSAALTLEGMQIVCTGPRCAPGAGGCN